MEFEPGKSPLLMNILPGLVEIGKIKIGRKGKERPSTTGGTAWRQAIKLGHFVVTTLERNPADNDNFVIDQKIMQRLGENPKRIPIRLLFDSVSANFQSRLSCYHGKTLWCSGDGRGAFRLRDVVKIGEQSRESVSCPCGREQPGYKGPDKCKMNGCLSCIIDGAEVVGGVWKFRTTGYNSTVGMQSSLFLIQSLSGGLLAGLDLDMTVQKKVGTDPDGRSVTIDVVGILFRGSINDLQKKSLEIATTNADFRVRLAHVETEVMKQIGLDTELVDQAADIVDEFHPEDAAAPPQLAKPGAQQAPAAPVQAPAQPAAAAQPAPVATGQQPTAAAHAAPRRGRRKASDQPAAPAQEAPPAAPAQSAAVPEPPPAPPMSAPDGLDGNLFDMPEGE